MEMRDNNNFLPKFCCDFVANNSLEDNCFQKNCHLRGNQLHWLLEKSDNYCNYWTFNQTIDLFGLNIDSNDLDSNQMKIVFTFIKKTLNELRTDSMTRSGNNRNESNDYRGLRDNVTAFLTLLRRRLFEICIQCKSNVTQKESKNTFCISAMKQMKGLLLFVGRLSQIRPQLIRLAISSDTKTSIFNYFHCCLDIWWTAIEMMYILDQNNEINLNDFALIKDQICGQQLCSQSIRLVLFDLIVFSVNRFKEMKASNKYQSSLFDCLCVKELYVLVRHMFSATNKSVSNQTFFELIFSTLNLLTNCDSNNCYPINDFKTIAFGSHSIEDSSLHFIWFVTNIVQTLNYDISGLFNQSLGSDSIPTPLLRRITQFFKQSHINLNEKLSAVIMFCWNAIKFWKPNTDLLLPFTEYFLKNLDKSFQNKSTVEELAVIPKTSTKWCQIIRKISDNRNNTFVDNSYYLFLSLMSQQFSSVMRNCEPKIKVNNWQKFKGKIVVNLHSNRLNSFDETAIFNLLSFYLVLINTNDEIWTDFIDIVIETNTRLIENNDNYVNNLDLVFKFMFAVIQCKAKSLSDQKISAFVGKAFNGLCEQSVKNLSLRPRFLDLIVKYLDELKILKSQFKERNLYSYLTKQLFASIVDNFFNKHESSSISSLIPFIQEFCKFDLNDEQLIEVFNGALLKIPFTDPKSKESLLSLISSISGMFVNQNKESVLSDNQVLTEFIETHLMNYNTLTKLFEVIDTICESSPKLLHIFIGQITRTIESIEKKRSVGTDYRLRNALRDYTNQKQCSFSRK